MAVTPKAVVVTDSHKKFEQHHALKGGKFSAREGDVASVISAPTSARYKAFVSSLK
jgi:ABC-type histidine transport system ATPase subunit